MFDSNAMKGPSPEPLSDHILRAKAAKAAGLGQGAEEEMPRFNPKASSTATHSLAKKLNQLTAEHIASRETGALETTRQAGIKSSAAHVKFYWVDTGVIVRCMIVYSSLYSYFLPSRKCSNCSSTFEAPPF